MASGRKEETVIIDDEGRDKGKHFIIKEMPCAQAEKWAIKAFLALTHSGVDIGDLAGSGMAGIAVMGLNALTKLSFEEIEPLMDEMFLCIKIMPDPNRPAVVRDLLVDDIDEVATRIKLRGEVFRLHTGFSQADAPSSRSSASALKQKTSSPTRMSRRRSA